MEQAVNLAYCGETTIKEKIAPKKAIGNGSRIKENGLFRDFKSNLLM